MRNCSESIDDVWAIFIVAVYQIINYMKPRSYKEFCLLQVFSTDQLKEGRILIN